MGSSKDDEMDKKQNEEKTSDTPNQKAPPIDHHRICYRTIRYFIHKYKLPYDFTPEKDINDHERRCDIILTRRKNAKDGLLSFDMRRNIVGEFKNYHRSAGIQDFLQLLHYAVLECVEHSGEKDKSDRGVTALLLCWGISRALKRHLKILGFGLEYKGNGVYNVIGVPGIDDFRIVVLRKLPGDEYACFRIIGDNADKEDIKKFLVETDAYRDDDEAWPWIDEIRGACLQVNSEQYIEAMEELKKMNQSQREYYERNCWTGREKLINAAVNERVNERLNQILSKEKKKAAEEAEKREKRGEKRGRDRTFSEILARCKDGVITVEELLACQAMLEQSANLSA